MTRIKIVSNPYKQEIEYKTFKESENEWIDVSIYSPNGKLREESARKCFLPFNAKEIIEVIIDEYYLENKDAVEIVFEGTKEEYLELLKVCSEDCYNGKINLTLSNHILDDGKYILSDTKDIFYKVKPVIEQVSKDELEITKSLAKVADALDDIIPICVFGNYSAGKSTFINALIGQEVLPRGAEPVTAKAFKIQNSEQEDTAVIKFKHWDDEVELSFSGAEYKVIKGNSDDEMLKELDATLAEIEEPSMAKMVSGALKLIDAYEKKDANTDEVGNMIELYIPFSKTGILGQSCNKFVVFDTPGSNTATNDGHIEVLKEALAGFSNGIPVWISQFETLDTMDNEALCNNILSIDALDKRFTMIVLNKADASELPEKGFSEKQIKNIKEFRSVEKMYASGIFFVSSIMGLGAKKDDKLEDRFYRKVYKQQYCAFSDVEDEDYMSLFQYNIMPLQIKEEIIRYSADENNLVYVNSGLHCIETEIETFASKYSAYNKCQMVYSLLSSVVEKTTEKIEKRVQARERLRNKYMNDLEVRKQQLILAMRAMSAEMDANFQAQSYASVNTYAKTHLDYNYPLDKLEELNAKYSTENESEYSVADKKKKRDDAVDAMYSNLGSKVKKLSEVGFRKTVAGLWNDAKEGFSSIYTSQMELEETQKTASAETVDEVLKDVIEVYQESMADAIQKINRIACTYWENNSQFLKDKLIELVTASDALSDKQKKTLSELIFNYRNIAFDDKASSIFVKPKFLHGQLLGLNLFTFEKLNTSKLAREYNKTIANNIESIATDMNGTYYTSYKMWADELTAMIEKNIVELNPELQVLSDAIDNENEQIRILKENQQIIRTSLCEIEGLISFKDVEDAE